MRIQVILAKAFRKALRVSEIWSVPPKARANSKYVDCFDTVRELRRLCSDSIRVVYDVGAAQGRWAATLHSFFPEVESVDLFEPGACWQQALNELVMPRVKKRVHRVALGDCVAAVRLQGAGVAASLLPKTKLQDRFFPGGIADSEDVGMTTLDEAQKLFHLPMPDLVKIDVQGYEDAVVAGGGSVLGSAKWMVIELSTVALYGGQRTAGEVLATLERQGWILASIGYQWRSTEGRLLQFDAILCRAQP